MKQFTVTGMSCAACQARVEKAVSAVPGVESCAVSLLTNSMGVAGDVSSADIIAAVEKAGYGASIKGGAEDRGHENRIKEMEESLKDRETPILKKRLISSAAFLCALMYFSMGAVMFGWPVPSFFDGNPAALALLQMLLAMIVMLINRKFFVNGFKGLVNRAPNMDSLVALGSGASFVWSVYELFAMTGYMASGNMDEADMCLKNLYFESAAMILVLITIGKMLESISKGRTTDALKSLMKMAPKTANVFRNGKEETIAVEDVQAGDIFLVRPGENIPVDGIIIEGESAVNESALTGESIPVDKKAKDGVSAATINQSGFLKCEASRVGQDTAFAQIIQMVSDAAATKAPAAKVADKVSGIFVPLVIGIAVLTTVLWMITGQTFGYALARGISVLVISCPCALGLATPVAIMVGNGMGARNGILFKTSAVMEEMGRINIIALDKTGTITKGEPEVTDIIPAEGITQDMLLSLAASLESRSEHPLAKAVNKAAEERGIKAEKVSSFRAVAGNGLTGNIEGAECSAGNRKFISGSIAVPDKMAAFAEAAAKEGKTPLYFQKGGKLYGIIAAADVIKEDSAEAVKQLKQLGIHVVMLTGDNRKTADVIGKLAGVDEVAAGVLPGGKEAVVRKLMEHGKVAMIGDGINDAPALAAADAGLAIGAGTDVAIDAADVVLMKSSLMDAAAAVRLSRQTLKNIHENLFWAFIYNVIGIPLAAGCYVSLFGWSLNPMFGAAAMSLSSFCVVSNALRLNLFKVYSSGKDKPLKNRCTGKLLPEDENNKEKGEKEMKEITLLVEGMMCQHCEKSVKTALEALDGVAEATADHDKGTVVVKLEKDVPEDLFKEAIESKDFTYKGIA